MRRFKSMAQAQRFLPVHGPIQNLFRVGRQSYQSSDPSRTSENKRSTPGERSRLPAEKRCAFVLLRPAHVH